jgi:phosphate acetyltransferase
MDEGALRRTAAVPDRFDAIRVRCRALPPLATAVAHPCDAVSIASVAAASAAGLITPTLIGPAGKIAAAAAEAGVDISGFALVDAPHSHAAAAMAVAMTRRGESGLLMKGSLHTDELMHEVVEPDRGLTTERRISHVYLMDVASYPRLLLITDAAVNIAPSLEDKRDIVQNAIELALAIGIATPRVAVLSAVETVSSKLKSTLDAAALCTMADRGQIRGGLVEGPLAFDNAVSLEAARAKGLDGPVAGQADILVTPDLESGNMLAKQLTFLAGARAAAVVVGARVPIVLTSRADSELTHVTSCAVARLFAEAVVAGAALRKVSA